MFSMHDLFCGAFKQFLLCSMDTMVVSEAIRHGLQIIEVVGSRSVVGNLQGVIFDITL